MDARPALIAAALLAVLLSPICRADDDGGPRYSLREGAPRTGTNIPFSNVRNSRIPFDKTYADMTADERANVKDQYERMGERDEPPFPVRGLGPIYKAIAAGQQKRMATGDLLVVAEIDSRGDMTSASIYQTPDDVLARYIVALLAQEKFKPALCEGVPCSMSYPFRIKLDTRY